MIEEPPTWDMPEPAPLGEYARLAKAVRNLLEAISDMPVRNSDVDDAAKVLRGELVDAGWDEAPSATLDT